MDDTLKRGNQEGNDTALRPGRRTPVQQLERWETEARLLHRRTKLRWAQAGQGAGKTALSAAAGEPAPEAASGRRTWSRPGSAAELWRAAGRELRRARAHLHRLRHEQKNQRFPESDRLPAQLLLFAWGMLPMLGGRVREKTWGRRRQAISRFGHIRAWFERKRGHPAGFLAAAGAIAVIALLSSFYTVGTTVTYKGSVVAKVSSELAARNACRKLENVTRQTLGSSYTLDSDLIRYDSGLMPRKDVVDGNTFEEELSGDIGLVTYGYALYVDGELVGATPYQGALDELLKQLKAGVTDANTISCDFQEQVEIKAEYVPSDKIMNLGYLAQMLYSTKTEEATYTVGKGDTWSEIAEDHDMTSAELLAMNPGYNIDRVNVGEVLTLSAAVPYLTLTVTERERYVEDVPYDIEYVDSGYLYKGDTKVISAGKDGAADVVANATYVNGEETKRTVLSYVTLVDPVTETQARGTKTRPTWTATGSFRWPCSGHVTSRFGYRNLSYSYASKYHEGIDIANRRGTAIYAADGGTVTYAGWMSGYGYLVRISHGNGYETYYGHNSKILVSVGQHVYRGQQVAKMGSTGNSTGNHCHFGVYYNGVAKNPMNYLG
ncbi:MAG: peptidoglycan DD-metalloendopeptidase family protein [Oscillibacter sp.]|jgi:murein DD-endopeptidase MepM/ murein hydrolase activator NlpD|nr:peptidoglycan DD-metalloendopeptidase family protein [Oscillibacter sp.]